VTETEAASSAVSRAVAAARAAQPSWSATPLAERLRWLDRFRLALVDALDDLAADLADECDKPRADAVAEVFHSCNIVRYYVKNARRILAPRRAAAFPTIHKRVWVEYEPYGVVGVLSPWNYPIILPLAAAVPALAAGNAVVVKPSELANRTALRLADVWRSLSPPADLLTFVEGGPEVGAQLAGAAVDKLSFTGGATGGRAVLRVAAERGVPVVLELGGSDAAIVCADADLDRAAHGVAWGAFLNAGQSCIGVRRCLVEDAVHDAFVAKLVAVVAELKQGRAAEQPHFGCVRTDRQIAHLTSVVQDAVARGANLKAGGCDPARGRCFPPTVLLDVTDDMRIGREEVFGPVLAVQRVASVEDAVRRANGTDFGLGASVWSARRGREIARRLQVGGVCINDCLLHFATPSLPFGGAKASGYGRSQGPEGLLEYCRPKAYLEHRIGPRLEPHWFKPTGGAMVERLLHAVHGRSWWDRLTALFRQPPRPGQ
jgi:succinate-semialdehyde dehydrogenase/glutarate-semialdehyde dehydrogenase